MHAIQLTFSPRASEGEIMGQLGPIVKNLVADNPGLIMKIYLEERADRWSGFYLFATKEDVDRFVEGPAYGFLSSSDLIGDFEARRYNVEDGPSAGMGTPTVPLAETRAAS
jgi:hypothetical protein